MIYINNPPIYNLHLNDCNKMNFVLLHLTEKEKYWKYFLARDTSKYTILDNSAFELGVALDAKLLMKIANELKVDEVVVPDVFENKRKTLDKLEDFFVEFPANGKLKYMLVPQGKDLKEMMECLEFMLEFDKVDNHKKVIGLNKLWDITTIPRAVQTIKDYSYNIDIHKLGCNNLREWFMLKDIIGLRSADSRIFAKICSGVDDPWDIRLTVAECKFFINLIAELKWAEQKF